MITTIQHRGKTYRTNLNEPIDISIPLKAGSHNVNAWYSQPVRIEPVVMGDWVGEVSRGGSVNFRNVFLNPHGNGTHTECVGHISKENYTLNEHLRTFFFLAEVITIHPEKQGDDFIITRSQIESACKHRHAEAIVLRTIPNNSEKLTHHYSNTNPPYLHHEATTWMVENGIKHLLLDLPSVDREKDDGKLLAHHAFWKYPHATRLDCTITELIYVPDKIDDGLYLLNIQITSLENDASPSKPVLYILEEVGG
jgi:arylformamidase